MRYLISYDLNTPGKNYQTLYDALAALQAHRALFSQWVARRTGTTAIKLRDHLRQYVDSNDRIMVVCLDKDDWASYNAMVDAARI